MEIQGHLLLLLHPMPVADTVNQSLLSATAPESSIPSI